MVIYFSLIIALLSSYTIYTEPLKNVKITQENTCFLFDWHETCAAKYKKEMLEKAQKTYTQSPQKVKLTLQIPAILSYAGYLKYGPKIGLTKKSDSADELLQRLTKQFSVLHGEYDNLLDLANSEYIYPEIDALIKRLKNYNFRVDLGSGIGDSSYQIVEKKFPDFFVQFDKKHFVYNDKAKRIPKTDPAYFIEVGNNIKKSNAQITTIIFIDDRDDFIASALKANDTLKDTGIQFIAIKATSPDKVVEDVEKILVHNNIVQPAALTPESRQKIWRDSHYTFPAHLKQEYNTEETAFWDKALTFFQNVKNKVTFGTASSAQQIEGLQTGPDDTNTPEFVENNWTSDPAYARGYAKNVGPNHYDENQMESDVDLARTSGFNHQRINFPWDKLFPKDAEHIDTVALDHYKNEVRALKEAGIDPWICLFHFCMPEWFDEMGGFTKEENIKYFVDFGKKVAEIFKEEKIKVTYWAAFNELVAYATGTYLQNKLPYSKANAPHSSLFPRKLNITHNVILNMMKAHIQLYDALKEINPENKCGFIHHFVPIDPLHNNSTLESQAVDYAHIIANECVLQIFEKGQMPWLFSTTEVPEGKGKLDWIGVNYYGSLYLDLSVSALAKGEIEVGTKAGQEKVNSRQGLYPEGLYRAIAKASLLDKPIFITEIGIDAKDREYIFGDWMKLHMRPIIQGLKDGFDIRGVAIWTLYTTLGWKEHKGTFGDYGIYTVNFRDTSLPQEQRFSRTLKQSANDFIRFLKQYNSAK